MTILLSPRLGYSRAEIVSDGVVHAVGLILAGVAVPVLIWTAVTVRGDWATVSSTTVYGVTLIAMLGCSAIYNLSRTDRWLPIRKRMDHSAIYLKIAGTYTPVVALTGGAGLPFLVGIWAAALSGAGLKIVSPDRLRWLGLALYLGLYLGLGWAGVALGGGLIDGLSGPALALVVAGGLTYTAGVAFFLWDRLPFHNTIWHVFVLAATICLYAAIYHEVALPRVA